MKLADRCVVWTPLKKSASVITNADDWWNKQQENRDDISDFFFSFFGWGKEKKMFSSCVEREFKLQSLPHFAQTTGFLGQLVRIQIVNEEQRKITIFNKDILHFAGWS